MDIFVDTADIQEIKTAFSWGIVDGVTTNPSLIKKAAAKYGGNMQDYIKQMCDAAGEAPVSLEVAGNTFEEMVREGKMLHDMFNPISNNVVIKIPVCSALEGQNNFFDGLRAIRALADQEISVNVTLIMTPMQALLAAKAGAAYVSPFAGRVDDYLRVSGGVQAESKEEYFPAEGLTDEEGEIFDDNGIASGVQLVQSICTIFEQNNIETEVLAASLRNVQQVKEVAEAGAQIATIPFKVLAQMIYHPKTVEGMVKFTQDVVPEYKALFGAGQPGVQPGVQSGMQQQQPPGQPGFQQQQGM